MRLARVPAYDPVLLLILLANSDGGFETASSGHVRGRIDAVSRPFGRTLRIRQQHLLLLAVRPGVGCPVPTERVADHGGDVAVTGPP